MDLLFTIANLAVLPFWFLVIFLPHWRGTQRIVASPLILVPLPILYTVLIVPRLGSLLPLLVQPDLPRIAAALGTPEGALLGWIHFLAFDLLVGRWAYLDSRQRGLSAWLVSPALFFVLMVGPFGLLLYLGLRSLVERLVGVRGKSTKT